MKKILILFAFAGMSLPLSDAAVLAQETFPFGTSGYTGSELTGSAGTGWSGSWGNASGQKFYVAASGFATSSTNGTAIIFRNFSAPLPTTQVWFSYRVHKNIAEGTARVTFFAGGAELLTGVDGSHWEVGGQDGGSYPVNTWQTVKGVIDYVNDKVVLWAGSDFSAASYDVTTGVSSGEVLTNPWAGSTPIDRIRLSKTGSAQGSFNDLLIATEGSDVGINTTMIPEPSAALLGGLGALALLRRRRC